MSLPPLKVKIGADTVDLDRAIENIRAKFGDLKTQTDRMGRSLQSFGDKTSNLGRKMLPVSAGMAAFAGAAWALSNRTANAAVEVSNLARVAGTNAEEFQRLAAAARDVGIDGDKLADIYKDMNDRVGDFMSTGAGPMADFFENIAPQVGVTADQFARLSGPEAMQLYVDSLEKAGASQQEMTFYMEALAGDASRLIPLLRNGGAEMTRLGDAAAQAGAIMDQESITAAREFAEQMRTLQDSLSGAANEIGFALMPLAVDLATAFQDKVVPAIVATVDKVGEMISWFGQLPGPVQEAAGVIATALGVGGPVLLAIGAMSKVIGGLLLATGPVGLLIGAAALLGAAWFKWGDDITRIVKKAAADFKENFGGIVEYGTIMFDGLKEQASNFIDLLGAIFSGDLRAVMDSLKEIMITPLRTIAALWESDFATPVRETVQGIGTSIKETFNGVLDFIKDIPAKFRQFGVDMMDGLRIGIGEAWEGVKASITEKVDWLPNWVKDRLGIASPSKVFQGFGQNIGQGLALGLQESAPMTQEAMRQMTDGLLGEGGGEVEGPSMGGVDDGGMGGGIGEKVAMIAEQFRTYGQNIGQNFADGIQSTRGMVNAAVTDMSKNVTGGAMNMASGVVDALGQMFSGSKPIAMAQALINTFLGVTDALKTKDFASAAKIAAQGLAAVAAIRSARPGSSGAAAGGAGSAAGGAAQQQPAGPRIALNIQPNAQGDIPMETFRGVVDTLNDQLGRGGRIVT